MDTPESMLTAVESPWDQTRPAVCELTVVKFERSEKSLAVGLGFISGA